MARRPRRPKFIVIYSITCVSNGKIYIGSSKDLSSRWNSHIYMMESYTHSIPEMIVDWHKYGPSKFNFSIVLMLSYSDLKDLRKKEQEVMDVIPPKKLYNKRRALASTKGKTLGKAITKK
jgi:group I intron endonuclease